MKLLLTTLNVSYFNIFNLCKANMIKKPTNLVGGQSTFIEKNVVEKAVAKIVAVVSY